MTAALSRLRTLTHRDADWSGLRVTVAGLGVSGFAAATALLERGARVTVVDGSAPRPGSPFSERVDILDVLGARLRLGDGAADASPSEPVDLVVTSPGWSPGQPLLAGAAAGGVPVWGEVELAWRMRPREGAAPWLTVTGTNGKTTTVRLLAGMLAAAGLRTTTAGNVGTPLLEVVLDPQPHDVLAVELSSFQLYWSRSIRPRAAGCLNVASDHVDWHGSLTAYTEAKGLVYEGAEVACVYNVEDPVTRRLVEGAQVQEGCRAVGFTLGVPAISELGLVDGILADRAFVTERESSAAELGTLEDLHRGASAPAPHLVANALAAAALARSHGVPPAAVRAGLRGFRADPHRAADAGVVRGIRFIDDSKATNPHAAEASIAAHDRVVWIAGGLLKGADVDDLVRKAAPRLRGVVLLGRDRVAISAALARHAPNVPVVDVARADTGAMDQVVAESFALARAGDVVLLAPAAASMDMFDNYAARGDAFVGAVRRVAAEE
ncbi:MAG: UDP-N-acetylmuramoyl-L-alanine--D-glutamate ligase [Dermatophilaceae bacterium]